MSDIIVQPSCGAPCLSPCLTYVQACSLAFYDALPYLALFCLVALGTYAIFLAGRLYERASLILLWRSQDREEAKRDWTSRN
jgi:hypothetical protein